MTFDEFKQIEQGKKFLLQLKEDYPDNEFIPEMQVFDEDSLLAGTIDLVSWNRDTNEVNLYDYKTNKKITLKPYEPDDYGLYQPVKHLTNCKVNTYYLQLLIYSYIMEKNYGAKVKELVLIHVQDDSYTTYTYKIDYKLREEVIQWRKDNAN